jgi:hypothetical protein
MWRVRDLQQKISLLRFECDRLGIEHRDLIADPADLPLQFFTRLIATALCPDLFTQSLSAGVELLQRSLSFPALPVDAEDVVQLCLVSPTPRRDAAFYKVRLFPDQTDVEHGADCRVRCESRQILILFLMLLIMITIMIRIGRLLATDLSALNPHGCKELKQEGWPLGNRVTTKSAH